MEKSKVDQIVAVLTRNLDVEAGTFRVGSIDIGQLQPKGTRLLQALLRAGTGGQYLRPDVLFRYAWSSTKEAEYEERGTDKAHCVRTELCRLNQRLAYLVPELAACGASRQHLLWENAPREGYRLRDASWQGWEVIDHLIRIQPGDPYISPMQPGEDFADLGVRCLAANWTDGWTRGTNLPHLFSRGEVPLPDEVKTLLSQLRMDTENGIRAERESAPEKPFFVSTLATVRRVFIEDDACFEVTFDLGELDYLTLVSLRRNLDTPDLLGKGLTLRQCFLDSPTWFPAPVGANLFLMTKGTELTDRRFIVGRRTRAVDESGYPEHYSHASGGCVVTKVPPEKSHLWSDDIDESTGLPDVFLTAKRECREEAGCIVALENIVFTGIVANPDRGTVDIYGLAEVEDQADSITTRPKMSGELVHLALPPAPETQPSDADADARGWWLEEVVKHVGTELWVPEDRLGVLLVLSYVAQHILGYERGEEEVFRLFRRWRAPTGVRL